MVFEIFPADYIQTLRYWGFGDGAEPIHTENPSGKRGECCPEIMYARLPREGVSNERKSKNRQTRHPD